MRRTMVVVLGLAGVGVCAGPVPPVLAQARVVVPIVVPLPRSAPLPAGGPTSVLVTTQTLSSPTGLTTTRVTVRETSGASRNLTVSTAARSMTTVSPGASSLRVTTVSSSSPAGLTTTRVTVRETSGASQNLTLSTGAGPMVTVPARTSSVPLPRDRGPDGTGALGRTLVTVEDVSQAGRTPGSSAVVSIQRSAGRGQETLTITSEAPIDAPIVILVP